MRGPTWQEVPLAVPGLEVTVRIANTATPAVLVNDAAATPEFQADGRFRIALVPGSNQVCLIADPAAPIALAGNRTCVDVIALGR